MHIITVFNAVSIMGDHQQEIEEAIRGRLPELLRKDPFDAHPTVRRAFRSTGIGFGSSRAVPLNRPVVVQITATGESSGHSHMIDDTRAAVKLLAQDVSGAIGQMRDVLVEMVMHSSAGTAFITEMVDKKSDDSGRRAIKPEPETQDSAQ